MKRECRAAAVIAQLRDQFGERLTTNRAIREAHGRGEALSLVRAPDAVVFPEDGNEVATIVRACFAHHFPVIPFGAGTSLEGQLAAVDGGIAIDLSSMNRILAVHPEDLDCRVEAGVTREQLNAHLRDTGLFFPLDPGADATIGGMAATRASGTNAVRYGTMREMVLGLTVVTPSGDLIRTGTRARKSSAGYDLTRLYVGSEGTLGVITEVQLRLTGIPECVASGFAQFKTVRKAVRAVIATIQMGVPVARMELLDAVQMGACIAYSRLVNLAARPTLFVEFHGSPAGVAEQVKQVRSIFAQCGGTRFRWAEAEEDRRKLWKARHDAYHAARSLAPGKSAIATDACVPISHLAAAIGEAQREARRRNLLCPLVGHVGDGNFHLLILYDAANREEEANAEGLAQNIAIRAIKAGGTCSGEHGIGLHKRALLTEEAGASATVMFALKHALDPSGIMNPGKTLPLARDEPAAPPACDPLLSTDLLPGQLEIERRSR